MLFKPEYDENGKKVLCEMNGINSEMLMDIYVKKLKKGETLEIIEENNECAIFQAMSHLKSEMRLTSVAKEKTHLKKSLMQFIFASRLKQA